MIKSNDPDEGLFLPKSLKEMFDSKLSELKNSSRIKYYQDIYNRLFIDNEGELQLTAERINKPVLALCFCGTTVPLALWRAYGNNGQGIAIGIHKDKLQKITALNQHLEFNEVQYFSEKQIRSYVRPLFDDIQQNSTSNSEIEEQIIRFSKERFFIKHNENSFEKEWRLAYIGGKYSPDNEINDKDIDVYFKSNDAVMCYKIPLANFEFDSIKIGPQCKASVREIKHFLNINGIDCKVEKENIAMR